METTSPRSPGGRVTSLAQDGSPASGNASSWGAPRLVRIRRSAGRSLGISIVGGRVAGHGLQHSVSGIFIKHVSEASANRREGILRTGDRILEVSGRDLRDATHDEAVDAIRSAPSPVEFCVQSLVNPSCPTDMDTAGKRASPDCQLMKQPQPQPKPHSPPQSPPITQPRQQIISEIPAWDETNDNAASPNMEVSQRSADSNSDEDEFGYPVKSPEKRLAKKYVDINGQILVLDIEKRNRRNLGISLAGNRDTSKMSVFVCGIRPDGAAAEDGRLRIGDELLEVNGHVLLGKSHLNAAPLIIGCQTRRVKLVIVRRPSNIASMAVKPMQPPFSLPVDYVPANARLPDKSISPGELERLAVGGGAIGTAVDQQPQAAANGELAMSRCDSPPVALEEDDDVGPEPEPSKQRQPPLPPVIGPYGVEYTCTLVKGKQGLGFAIMERNFNEEPGIYVKHITDGGPAADDGTLRTGDRLLRANGFQLAEATYDEALDQLRSMSGAVDIMVGRQVDPATAAAAATAAATAAAAATASALAAKKEVRLASPGDERQDGKQQQQQQQQAPPSPPAATEAAKTMVKSGRIDGQQPASTPLSASPPSAVAPSPASPSAATTASSAAAAAAASAGSNTAGDEASGNPATCDIQVGRDTVIEINKGDSSLGVSIVGGSDTALHAIIIHEVYEAGAAGLDRRLRPGDQILAIGDRSLSGLSHDDAKSAILQAGPRVRLRVRRDDKAVSEADLYELHRLDLVRKPGRGLGFSIVARSRDEGVQVSDIIKGGAAESDNRLQPGDRILEINGTDVRKTPHSEVAAMLKSSSQGKVSFLIGRLKHVGSNARSKRKGEVRKHKKHCLSSCSTCTPS